MLAFIALMVALGGTALAATGTLMNIADPSNAANIAKVDSPGRLRVGDGSGSLTVDGTVTARPLTPSAPWQRAIAGRGSPGAFLLDELVGPTSRQINVSSLTIAIAQGQPAGTSVSFSIDAYRLSGSATSCSKDDPAYSNQERLYAASVNNYSNAPFAISFTTPLAYRPPTGYKGCLFLSSTVDRPDGHAATFAADANGYLGG